MQSKLILLLIIFLGLTIRIWGINFGLPHIESRPDETTIVKIALKFGLGDLNPHFFRYPTLYMYVVFMCYILYYFGGLIFGRYKVLDDFITESIIAPKNFYLIDRFITIFFGTLTIYVVYRIAEKLFDKETAIISSLFLSFAYLHVRESHFGVTDVFMTFLVILTIFYILKSYKDSTITNYIRAGLFGGLAMSTKYNALLVIVPMFIVHHFNTVSKRSKFLDKKVIFFVIIFIIGFLIGTPFAILDFKQFTSDFLYEMKHLSKGHDIILGIGWWYHLRFSLFYGLGWTLFFASLAGISTFMIKRDIKKTFILLSFPLIYYILIGRGYTVFVRYAIPLIPFLCITAAVFVNYITNKIFSKHKNYLAWSLGILIVIPSLINIIQFNTLLTKKDNRVIVAEWIKENIHQGSSVCQFGSLWGKVQIYPIIKSLEEDYGQITQKSKKIVIKKTIEYMSQNNIEGYELWEYNEKSDKFIFRSEENRGLPEFIIIEKSPLIIYSKTPERIAQLIDSTYRLEKTFEVINIKAKENLFDQQDAFYLPFHGFKDIERPGPNIYIYNSTDTLTYQRN